MPIHSELRTNLVELGYGPNFQSVWLDEFVVRYGKGNLDHIRRLNEFLLALKPGGAEAGYYVLSSIERGTELLAPFRDGLGAGKSVLDVGCGFGGILIAAGRMGADVHGIELNPHRLKSANALLEDNGLRPQVTATNVFAQGFDQLPAFDFVCSVNVVEHVDDPRRFIKRLAQKLKPGGTLFLEIPNRDAVALVAADPHYHIPILTQLSHHSARALFNQHMRHDIYGMPYDVGEYFPLSFYRNILTARGLTVDVRHRSDAVASDDQIANFTASISRVVKEIRAHFPKIDAHLREEILIKGKAYLRKLKALRKSASFDEQIRPAQWLVTATKPEISIERETIIMSDARFS